MNAVTTTASFEPRELVEIATELRNEVEAAERSARSASEHAMRVGELLARAKTHVPHGEWLPWLESNTTLSKRTAQAYMRFAKRFPELPMPEAQRVALLPVREAVAAIATPADAPPRSPGMNGGKRETRDRWIAAFDKDKHIHKRMLFGIRAGYFRRGDVDGFRSHFRAMLTLCDEIEAQACEAAEREATP